MGSLVESIKQAAKDKKRSRPCQNGENHDPGSAEKPQKRNSCSVSWLDDNEKLEPEDDIPAKQQQEGQRNTPAAPCQPAAFYSPWRISQIEESVRRLVKRAKDKVQQGVFAAPFQYFLLQEPAFQFADRHDLAPDLRVFSLEMDDSGRRNFIVTTYDEFWKIYWQTVSAGRHHYEIIREGYPCHLYFDLEFKVEFNRGVDGQALVDAVIQLAAQVLKEQFDLDLKKEGVVELDSSNTAKFSRHLVILLEGHAFRSNAHVGYLVGDMCAKVWEEGSEFQNLQVAKDAVGGKTTFIDKGVYSRNRAFRLVLSSKAGKDSFLQPTGRFRQVTSMTRVFYDSLICNVPDGANLLACFQGDPPLPASKRASGSRWPSGLAAASAPKRGPSPFPEIEDFILSNCTQDGMQGFVRDWQWWPQEKILVLNIGGNRFCTNIGRHHKSNGIYFVADVKEGTWFQKCHDPECRGFRSEIMPLPVDLFRRIHEGFASAAAAANTGLEADGLFEDGVDDAALLQAVQEAEASHQRLATPEATGSQHAKL